MKLLDAFNKLVREKTDGAEGKDRLTRINVNYFSEDGPWIPLNRRQLEIWVIISTTINAAGVLYGKN